MKFQPCTYNYSAFRDADIFFSHGSDFIGWLIRVGQRGIDSASDLSQPNHAGFLYQVEGQWFAAEVADNGIQLNSIDEYQKADNQIVGIMRFSGFSDPATVSDWRKEMALWIRRKQNSGYDFNGAIHSAIKWWPWLGSKDREFCSKDVCAWLIKYGCVWLTPEQDPADLYDTLTRRKDSFEAVLGYKNIP